MKTSVFLLIFLATNVYSHANENKFWPYPQDIPKSQSLSISMAGERPIDISRFLLARGAMNAQLNNDASYIAYTSNITGITQLWVKSINSGKEKQLTYGNGASNFYWHPDGQHILYAADNNGDEREAFFLIGVDGLKEKVLLPHSNAYRAFGAFTHSGTYFSYASTERNGRDFDIYQYDIENNVSTMIYQDEFGFYPANWQPQTQNLLMLEQRGEDAANLYLLDSKTKKSTVLFKPKIAADINSMVWTKDGSGFYFSSNLQSQMNQVLFYDSKSQTTRIVASDNWNLTKVKLCNNDKYLVWAQNNNGYDQLTVLDLHSKKQRQIEMHKGVYQLSCSSTNDAMTVLVSAADTPGSVYLVNLTTLNSKLLLAPAMAGINPNELKQPEVIQFTSRDGIPLQGLLYLPTNIKKGLLPPVVIDIHGGPSSQAKPNWQPLTQYLIGKGIAVIDINVRGSTGFGKDLARLDNQEKRLDSVRDLIDTLAYLKKDNRVNAERAAVMGGSYGGYMVNAVMGAYPDAFKAGASFVGVSNWVRALETASPSLKASDRIEYGDIRDEKWQSFYANNSPINTADKIKAPMFYQHGVNDPRDPVTESDAIVKVLRNNNVPVKYMRFVDEGHRISKVSNRVLFSQELANFLEKHL